MAVATISGRVQQAKNSLNRMRALLERIQTLALDPDEVKLLDLEHEIHGVYGQEATELFKVLSALEAEAEEAGNDQEKTMAKQSEEWIPERLRKSIEQSQSRKNVTTKARGVGAGFAARATKLATRADDLSNEMTDLLSDVSSADASDFTQETLDDLKAELETLSSHLSAAQDLIGQLEESAGEVEIESDSEEE